MSRKLRLLVVGPTPPPFHGVATFIRDLLAANHPGVETVHLDTSDRRDTENIGRWDPTNLQLGFANLSDLAMKSLRSDIDAVYVPISQNVPAFLRDALFILEARALGKKVIIHLHGGYFRTLYDGQNAVFQATARGALNCASAIMVLGKEFVPIFSGLVPDDRIHVVENGVPDPGAWELRESRQTGMSAPLTSAPTLLYMGTLTRTKGVLELIQALALLRATHPSVRMRIAGRWAEDDLRTETEAFIARENLSGAIDFVGNVDGATKAEFLASGSIFCLPTRYPYEGQPLVILEAMAAGLPVLSTQHGAIPSTVLDGVTGRLLIKESTPSQIATALHEMLGNENAHCAMKVAARQRYLELYTLNACHERLFKIVENACAPMASKS